jgi:sugar fermentation stimulation protein A
MLLRRRRGKRIAVGRLGRIYFPRGFYIYVGSALRDLTRRVERHRRTGKAPHWHIDYLRNEAEWHGVFPVRTADDLECRIAAALRKITERSIPFFGSSDCACPSHLFAMDEDPLEDPEFVRLLLHFRMDRLLERQLTIGDAGGSSGRE